jgi:hypothetical protein
MNAPRRLLYAVSINEFQEIFKCIGIIIYLGLLIVIYRSLLMLLLAYPLYQVIKAIDKLSFHSNDCWKSNWYPFEYIPILIKFDYI